MASPAPCKSCGALLRTRRERIERRREYRTVRGQQRLRTWRVAILCRPCAETEWSEHDGTAPPSKAAQCEIETVASVVAAFPGAELVGTPRPVQSWPPAGTVFDGPVGRRTIRRDPGPPVRSCGWCRGPLGTEPVEVRREYRNVGSLARLRTWTVGTVCRACADARAAEHDGREEPAAEAVVLL